jgi:3',5'-cyclic AMP phosphodiesterase CpdA
VVPGNHDTAWWTAPMGLGSVPAMTARYRQHVSEELEPVLHIPGATIVGLNSAHGIRMYTLTARPRDLSVVGALVTAQWDKAQREFAAAPRRDVRVLVFHHNLLRGEISNRWGLANRAGGIANAVATGAQIVLCGHDHQAAADCVDLNGKRMVVACASTLTTRVRGGGPGAINVLEIDEQSVQVSVLQWSDQEKAFTRAIWSKFSRSI